MPGDPDGLCLLHSFNKEKDKEGAFTDAIKKKMDNNDYDFKGVFFPIDFSIFSGRQLTTNPNFSFATFSGETDFSKASFPTDAYFIGTVFYQKVMFNGVHIWENTNVYFRGTDFSEEGEVIFRGAKIYGRLLFEQINLPDKKRKRPAWHGDFIRLDIGPNAILRFRDVSLAFVKFEGTDLTKIDFDDAKWYPLWSRIAVYEEINLKENPSYREYARVEKIYRQLKTNYKYRDDYKRIGDFHYGEMEMHRKASTWRRWISLYSVYWALSGYGERPLRAFIWLLALIPIWAGLVWGLGIDRASSQVPANYWDTLLFIFEKVTFQRPALPAGLTWLGKFLSGLSVLLIPGQAALFILALRNRLGRRR